MRLIYAMLLGFILDLIFGDPHGLIHPVQIIGWFIDKLKKGMQHMIYGCSYEEVREKEIERKAGVEKTAGFFLMLYWDNFWQKVQILYNYIKSSFVRICKFDGIMMFCISI